MTEYLADRKRPDKPQTKAAMSIELASQHAMLHAIITDLGGEVTLDKKRFVEAMIDNLKIAIEEADGGYVLRAETREERREKTLRAAGIS